MSLYRVVSILSTFLITALVLVCAIYVVNPEVRSGIMSYSAQTLINFILAGILGTFAAFVLNQYANDRQARIEAVKYEKALQDARHELRVEALKTLTTLYWKIRKDFFIIQAHSSPECYDTQMQHLVDEWIQLKRFDHDVFGGMYFLEGKLTVTDNLEKMERLLRGVIDEWRTQSPISDEHEEFSAVPEKSRRPTGYFPVMEQVAQGDFATLHAFFEDASKPIRDEIRKEL